MDPRVEGPYGYLGGTSMAAPQVTGTAALIRKVGPDLNADQVETAIERGAEPGEGRNDPELGAGQLNAHDALE